MGRKIVVLSDGTGNAAGKLFRTNVWRVYQALDLSTDQQIAFYDDGVGNSSFKPLALLGGALGWGLKRNIIDLYTFICENYRETDTIYGFGFSRGAFTIRVLTKFVLSQGLVKSWKSTDDLKRQARVLYREFKSEQKTRSGLVTAGRAIRDALIYACSWAVHLSPPKQPQVTRVPKIRFLGLWDTVDAYGLPVHELKVGIDQFLWPLALEDRDFDSRRIVKACHALSIDDRRTTFHPLLWDEQEADYKISASTGTEQLTQVWFAGVHSNLGGGYPDDALSYVSLRWILREAINAGLVFNEIFLQQFLAGATPFGTLYDSRKGLGAYYRYDPRRMDPPTDNQGAVIPCPKIHETVFERMTSGSDEYAPLSLPNRFKVVRVTADEKDLVGFQRRVLAGKKLPKRRDIVDFEDLPASSRSGRSSAGNGRRIDRPSKESVEIIWDTVWWRRVTYFAALFFTALLLAFPFIPEAGETAWVILLGLMLPFVAILLPFAAVAKPAIRFLADLAEASFPSAAKPWIAAFQLYPWKVSFLIAAIVAFLLLGAMLDRRIKDRVRAAWNPQRLKIRIQQSVERAKAKRSVLRKVAWAGAILFVVSVVASVSITGKEETCAASCPWWDHVLIFVSNVMAEGFFGTAILFFWFWLFFLIPIVVFLLAWARANPIEIDFNAEIPSAALLFARRCRRSQRLNRAYRFSTGRVIPALFALTVVCATVVITSRLGFAYLDGIGSVCKSNVLFIYDVNPGERVKIPFDFRSGCTALTIAVQPDGVRGLTLYGDAKLAVAFLPDPEKGGYLGPPEPYFDIKSVERKWYKGLLTTALTPFRRNLSIGWLKPIVRLGGRQEEGFDEHEIGIKYKEIEVKGIDRMFVYLNDAVFGLPRFWDLSYRANRHSGFVVVKRVAADEGVSVVDEEENLRKASRPPGQ